MEYDVVKIDEEFYIYALLGNKGQDNYSISIEGVEYMKGAEVSDEKIVKNFTITNETADFSVNPGFVLTTQEFYIEVQNLQEFKIEVEVVENQTEASSEGFFDFLFKDSSSGNIIELKSGEIKQLQFGLGNQTSFRIIEIKTDSLSYKIPVYVFVDLVKKTITSEEINESEENETTSEDIIDIIVGDNETQIKSASTKTCEEINGTICSSEEKCGDEASTLASDAVCCMSTCEPIILSRKSCEELNGSICSSEEKCTDEIPTYASGSVCCIETCEQVKKSSSGKLLGWLMIGVIVIALIWFFKNKSKHKRKKIDLFKIAKGKS